MKSLIVPRRFNGPANSGNGGWTAGSLAQDLPGSRDTAVTVRLHRPPPLDTPLALTETPTGSVATHQGRTVAEASYAELEPEPLPPVTVARASEAEEKYVGLASHPFPTCFVCGTDRRSDDGLRVFAGPVEPGRVAATWTPYEVSVPITWGALDCPGAWASDIAERMMVLGQITVRIRRLPRTSERYVVTGAVRGAEGRKTFTATTLHDADGEVLAAAEHVWITVDPDTFG
ncbi:hypothetical protein KUV85_16395 [Nocardioides panacisoli]|uniref:hypothetical protein n=1 Tax=Nocardioides panacisoli TaxID=627624 RepID=UPI001C62653C|nr:hypothetical protein [Nocardioides panacisoli]QYJ03881.1 hypothetical protein KUV85_16395 [Nocardioides panacisoli]